jgi:hypothetical protein
MVGLGSGVSAIPHGLGEDFSLSKRRLRSLYRFVSAPPYEEHRRGEECVEQSYPSSDCGFFEHDGRG